MTKMLVAFDDTQVQGVASIVSESSAPFDQCNNGQRRREKGHGRKVVVCGLRTSVDSETDIGST